MKKLQPHKIREVSQHVGITEKDEGRKLTSVSTFWATCSRCSNLLKKKNLIFKLPEMLLETSPVEQPVIHMKMAVFLARNSPPEVLL